MEYYLFGPGFSESIGRYRLTVSNGHTCRFSEIPTNRLHSHNFYELCFIRGGSGTFSHGRENFEITEGDLIVSDPQTAHEISSYETKDLELVFFRLQIEAAGDMTPASAEEKILSSFLAEHNFVSRQAFHLLHYIPLLTTAYSGSRRDFGSRNAVRSMVLEGLDTLALNRHREGEELDPVLNRALDYIERNICERLTVAELARELAVSERHLRRIFKAGLGKKVIDVIIERRMGHAGQLLAMNWRVNEVSFAMNYDDPAQFSRLFKKCYDLSPKEYRSNFAGKSL